MKKAELIPVIHMTSLEQVFKNVETCIKCGIKKVFLINHVVTAFEVLDAARKVKSKYPDLWVGINLLGLSTSAAMALSESVDGLWVDGTISIHDIREFKGLLFGGLAFKYQKQPKDLQQACLDATFTTDVATTSGPGTGKAASVEKIKDIRYYLGSHPMAIASGISAENADDYSEIAEYFLVASSITDSNEMLIEEKLVELKAKLT